MSIISSINTSVGKASGWTAEHWFAKSFEKAAKDPAKYAAAMLVTSIVSKDAVGCFLYTTQSLANKKIPEEKRKFVAALDLMNGIIMVGGQLAIGKLIERKFTPKFIGNNISGTFKDKDTGAEVILDTQKAKIAPLSDRKIYENYIKTCKKHGDKLKQLGVDISDPKKFRDIGEELIKKYGKESKQGKAIITGCGLLISALATTAFVKRTIAPLLATPAAGWFKGRFMDDVKKSEKTEKPEEQPKQNLDDKLLSHEVAPWNHSNADGDKVTFSKIKQN